MDGFNVGRKHKIFWICIAILVVGSWAALDVYYGDIPTNKAASVSIGRIRISVYSEMIDAEGTLVLFFCRQIYTLMRRQKQATIVRIAPYFQIMNYEKRQFDVDAIL